VSDRPPDASGGPEDQRPTSRERWVLVSTLIALGLALWLVHVWITVLRPERSIFSFDSAEYALAGRHLARTGKLATPFAFPESIPRVRQPPFALVAGHPLLPVLEAPLFKLFGERAWLTLVPVGLAYLATVALAGLLALEASGVLAVGLLAGLAVALQPNLLESSADGLSDVPGTALMLAATFLLSSGRPHPGRLGCIVGLAHLARPVMTPTLPAWIAAVSMQAPSGARLRHVARWLMGFAPSAALLLFYKWAATGNPLTDVGVSLLLVDLSPEFPKENVPRMLHPPNAVAWILEHPGALIAKLQHWLPVMVVSGLRLGGWATGLAFLFHLVRPDSRSNVPLRVVLAATLIVLILLSALTVPRLHYLLPLVPAAVALGLTELWRIARSLRASVATALLVLSAVVAWTGVRPLVGRWRSTLTRPPGYAFTEREVRGLGEALAARLPRDAVVVADMAPWVAWYADRVAVSLPMTAEELAVIRDRLGVDAVVLTNEWLTDLPGNDVWRRCLEGRAAPPGWTFSDSLAVGRLRARVLVPG